MTRPGRLPASSLVEEAARAHRAYGRAVTKHVFEINVHGEISPGLLAELGATRATAAPVETVITMARLGPDHLHRIVGRIADLDLDVVAVRRLPDASIVPAT